MKTTPSFPTLPERQIVEDVLISYYGDKVDTTMVVADIFDSLADQNYDVVFCYQRQMPFSEVPAFFEERHATHPGPMVFQVETHADRWTCVWDHPASPHLRIIGFPGFIAVTGIDAGASCIVPIS